MLILKKLKIFLLLLLLLTPNVSYAKFSEGEMTYSCEENSSKNYSAYSWKFNVKLYKDGFNGKYTFYRSVLKRNLERTFNGYVDKGRLYIKSEMNDVDTPSDGIGIQDKMKKIGYTINFKNLSLNKSLKQILSDGVKSEEGGRSCILKLVKFEEKHKTVVQKNEDDEAKIRALEERLAKEKRIKQKSLDERKAKEEAQKIALAKKKAEEKAKQKAMAEKKALAKKQAEKLAKQKAMAEKKAKEEAQKKALAKKKAEELAKQKALAQKKAEELAKQKALAAKKAEEEALKQKVLNEKIAKIKDEAQFIVETLKEYVTTDNNKLDILEVSELLENYDNEKQKGWSDATIEKYEALYDYVQKDDGFVTYSSEKKSKQLAAYNEEIRQLREYLSSSQSSLKAFITKNLGSKNAKEALKLAKETKAILKDFDVSNAMSLKNNIATWKAMNGVKEDKKYSFKLLNKKSGVKNVKKSSISSSKALNTSPKVNKDDDGKFEKEYEELEKKKRKTVKSGMVCVPFGAREDRVLNKIMANNHKGRCVRATKGKVYYENMTGRYQRSIDCNYSNGVKISISAKLYWKNGCSRYIN